MIVDLAREVDFLLTSYCQTPVLGLRLGVDFVFPLSQQQQEQEQQEEEPPPKSTTRMYATDLKFGTET